MLRLAFDFIITWRETRTRPNAYLLSGRLLRPTTVGHTSHCSRTYVPLPQDVRSTTAGRNSPTYKKT